MFIRDEKRTLKIKLYYSIKVVHFKNLIHKSLFSDIKVTSKYRGVLFLLFGFFDIFYQILPNVPGA